MSAYNKKILIVEDDLGIIELMKDTITSVDEKLLVYHFTEGRDAFEWILGNNPDLILLDYALPDMNAANLIEDLKSAVRNVPPFIISSGAGDERIAVDMMRKGARDYVIKDALFFENLYNVLKKIFRELDTERALAVTQEQLKKEREQLISILDGMNEIIFICDPDSYELLYINSAFKNCFKNASVGDICYKAMMGLDVPCEGCENNILFSGDLKKTITYEYKSAILDKWFRRSSRAIRWVNGKLVRFVMDIDITDSKDAEEENKKLEIQIQRSQKLESLGVLAGGIAHDFNNLLNIILGNIELTIVDHQLSPSAKENLISAEMASRQAAELCQQMLAYSGKGQFIVEAISVNDIIRNMTQMIDASISKKAAIEYNLMDDLPKILADASQIRQIVLNLVLNASEAIGEKTGKILLATGCIDCSADYMNDSLFKKQAPGKYIFIEVSDNGVGMDENTLQRIFDPFFTTKFTGRGLGLAAVLGIVRGHNGFLKVNSRPGVGTSMKAHLPVLSCVEKNSENIEEDLSAWKGSGTVLLVDDVNSNLVLGQKILKRLGFSVITASDGLDALEKYKAHEKEISCIILDMMMPNMDGAETLHELKKINSSVKVIICSGFNEQDISQRFTGQDIIGVLQKPYRIASVSAMLKKSMENQNL